MAASVGSETFLEMFGTLALLWRILHYAGYTDGLPGLYGFKYDSGTACRLPLYLCSYKLVGSATCPNHLDSLVYKLFPMLLGILFFYLCNHCSIDSVFYKCQSAEWLEGGASDNTCRRLEEHWELHWLFPDDQLGFWTRRWWLIFFHI